MRRATAGHLTRHRALQQDVDADGTFEQFVDGNHGSHGAGAARPDAALERQPLVYRQRNTARRAEPREQRGHGGTGRVLRHLARQPSAITLDGGDGNARPFGRGGHDDVAGFVEGEAEDVETAGDIGDSGRSEGGDHGSR